jgi:uncharacterized sulfatase
LVFAAWSAAVSIVPTIASAKEPCATRPNIVLVLIDDMGWGDFSCFGNQAVETPNIDRLAAEGLRFEQFYVNSPICSPSRVAISTGQYPIRWRITSFLNHRKANEQRGMAQWLDPKAPMLARMLNEAGYATGHFGKWHLGGQRDVGDAPQIREYGFEESLTNFEGLGPRVLPLLDAYDGKPAESYSLGSERLNTGPITWEKRDKVTASFTAAAIDFIKRAGQSKRPFYINVWPDDVHSPFFPPKTLRGDSSKKELYAGVLKTMDAQLAPLFDHIRNDASLRNNTLVIVCSDNGPEEGAGSAGPFRGQKAMLYEGGIRSPLVVWGPGLIPPSRSGSVNTASILAAIDLVPSLLELAGVRNAQDVAFDGEALPEVFIGLSEQSRKTPLYFRRPPDRPNHPHEGDLPDLCVRDGRWKLLAEFDGSEPELYNLKTDSREARNVASDHPELVNRLTTSLLQWHQSMTAYDERPARKHRHVKSKGSVDDGTIAGGLE